MPKMWKSCVKPSVNLCGLFMEKFVDIVTNYNLHVENHAFTHTFPATSTPFSTMNSSLSLLNNIHFSTKPITITTNNILIKR